MVIRECDTACFTYKHCFEIVAETVLASLETNKQQFNRSGFVKTARAPIDCVQIQLDECVQSKYLGTRHMGQST